MSPRSLTARAQDLLPRAFHAYVAGLGRSLVSGDQLVYPASPGHPLPTEGRHDFDFLHGRWRVRNVRLKERLAGCEEWNTSRRASNAVRCWAASATWTSSSPTGRVAIAA